MATGNHSNVLKWEDIFVIPLDPVYGRTSQKPVVASAKFFVLAPQHHLMEASRKNIESWLESLSFCLRWQNFWGYANGTPAGFSYVLPWKSPYGHEGAIDLSTREAQHHSSQH